MIFFIFVKKKKNELFNPFETSINSGVLKYFNKILKKKCEFILQLKAFW